eukprot:5357034-Pyramimonas_sp.AAC.1
MLLLVPIGAFASRALLSPRPRRLPVRLRVRRKQTTWSSLRAPAPISGYWEFWGIDWPRGCCCPHAAGVGPT